MKTAVAILSLALILPVAAQDRLVLTTEYRTDPVGLQTSRPRFSWKIPAGGLSDVVQRSFRVRVQTAAGDEVWDSGEVADDRSLNVEYAGVPLRSSTAYKWTVEVADSRGRRLVSDPATFRMGVLRPEDWSARWITVNPATLEDFDLKGADWIGTNGIYVLSFEAAADDLDPRAAVESVAQSTATWRPGFAAAQTRPALLACAAASGFSVTVNGRTVMRLAGSPLLRYVDLAGHLVAGTNVVTACVDRATGGRAFLATLALPGGRVFSTGCGGWSGTRTAAPGFKLMRRVEKASPAFRKTFETRAPVKEAVLHITGLGFYEATLDGVRVGRKVLDPSPTDYSKRVLYSTYDVTDALSRPGRHALEALVGRGAYDEHVQGWDFDAAPWRATPVLLAQLELSYADGATERIVTDGSWRQVASPILFDDLREGEIHAPARPLDLPVAQTEGPSGRLEAQAQPGAEKTETWRPQEFRALGPGRWTVDFGQNLSGWARVRLRGLKAGQVVSFQYAEKRGADGHVVMDGNDQHFYYPHSVLRLAGGWLERDRFVSAGLAEEVYEPKFSYSGFRYLEIDGPADLTAADVEAYQVNTAFEPAGRFECSNDLMNRIHRLFVRAYLANFTDGVPTDCPQREKNGWTGDAQLAAEMGQYCFENTAGYEKWCRDLVDAQTATGEIPCIVPTGGWGSPCGPAWDAAISVVPWTLYRYRDDRRIVEETYPALAKYVRWGATRLDGRGLANYGLGDWCAPMPYAEWSRYTPLALTSTACWHESLEIAARAAKLLGRDADAAEFAALADKARQAAQRAFAQKDGTWAGGTQCAQALALAGGLADAATRGPVAAKLEASVRTNGSLVKCGIIGMKSLFRALSETGRNGLACEILSTTNYPSFGDWLAKGATTAWESWKGASSQNHIMFGDVSAWLFQYPAGIRLDGEANGFRRILLQPETDGLDWVKAAHESPYGTIVSEWRKSADGLDWTVVVPPNATATAVFPPGRVPRDLPEGVRALPPRAGRAAAAVPSGRYRFLLSASAVPVLGTRESTVAPKSGERLPAKSPLFLEPVTNANLLVNSSFEMDKVAHRVFSETSFAADAPRARVDVVTDTARHGRKSLRIATPPDARAILVSNAPRVGPGARVVYSVWLKADRPTEVAFDPYVVNIHLWGDGSTQWVGMPGKFRVTTDWTRFSVTSDMGARQAWFCPKLVVSSNVVCWVDAEQLEVSASGRPSDYRPAASVEAAFVLDRHIFELATGPDGRPVPATQEARLVTCDYATGAVTSEPRAFATSRYGRFALEAEVAGRPALPAEYAVVHALGPRPAQGLFIGMNGGQPQLRPGWSSVLNYIPDEADAADDYYRLLRLAGMGLLRIWDGDLTWRTVEPQKGRYRWAPLDFIVDGARGAGLDTMFVLGSTAFLKWNDPARDRAHTNWFVRVNARPAKVSGMPQWTTGLEIRDADWDDFNRDLARHAKGRIKYYEIVNEPNLQVADADYYVHLMKLAYGRIKAEDPAATVVGICSTGDFGGNLGGYIGQVGERGGFKYLDWMSFHPYSGPTDVTPKPAELQLAEINRIVSKYRSGCPVIEDELYYICDNAKEKGANRARNWRASNVIRRHVLDFAGGCVASAPLARDQIWHQGPELTGLDGRFNLAAHRLYANDLYVASNAFAHFLEGGRYLRKPDLPDGLNGGTFLGADGATVTVVWAKLAANARMIDVPKGATAYDLWGNPLAGDKVDVTEDAVYLVSERERRTIWSRKSKDE